jgi:transcription elongation GreA/GreB family factor|tara:strand:- start:2409 stop:2909 length:501 start_codon:yes stop_codon:yes gene_type:complete
MSRAFVKEPDGDQAETDLPVRPQSKHPNYITMKGLEKQKAYLHELILECSTLKTSNTLADKNKIKLLNADITYLKQRVESAIPIKVEAQEGEDIRFGATITLVDENSTQYKFTIVGQDEVDTENGLISWVSPLASALIGKQVGDMITWARPIGALELEIEDFYYRS